MAQPRTSRPGHLAEAKLVEFFGSLPGVDSAEISGDSEAGIKGIIQLLEDAKKGGYPTKQIEDARETVQRYQKDVAREVMGFDF